MSASKTSNPLSGRIAMRFLPILTCFLSLAVGSCAAVNQGLQESDPYATVVHTIGEALTSVEPAHIYEIDGEAVMYQRRSFQLPPGEHELRVWPEGPAQRMVPDLEMIERESIQVDSMRLRVEAGHHYFLGAKRTRTRPVVEVVTEEGTQVAHGDWQTTIEPVVVRVDPPVTWQRAATGLSGFFGSLALGPLLAGL